MEEYNIAVDVLTGRVLEAIDWPEKPLIKTHGIETIDFSMEKKSSVYLTCN